MTWERLADLKESNPIEVAKYAKSRQIDDQPAFAWWVAYTLKCRDHIISAVKSRYHKRTHKFGIQIPKTVAEAYELDKENNNTLWRDALAKEMATVSVAFDVLHDGREIPPAYQFMKCHVIFDVKMDSFKRKCRMVAGAT